MADRNIKVTVAYDGTDFLGWQLQKKGRTVQGVMQEGLGRMHGHPVHVLAAGRTDSGVHAIGQVANFHTDIDSIAPERFRDAVNSYLPRDVRILASDEVGPRFHARRSARHAPVSLLHRERPGSPSAPAQLPPLDQAPPGRRSA